VGVSSTVITVDAFVIRDDGSGDLPLEQRPSDDPAAAEDVRDRAYSPTGFSTA
jgi:hypothetical protein